MENKIITVNNKNYLRIPIKTKVLNSSDSMESIIDKYAKDMLEKDDIITISESPLAITQGRAVPVKDIKIGIVAKFLWKFVTNNPSGVGLRSATSMQCAIDEVGSFRILFAASIAAITKLFGRSGDFYRIAGKQAALIDAATTSPIPPYDKTVIKGPKNPEKVAQNLCDKFGYQFAIMDINDIGGSWMIGGSSKIKKNIIEQIMIDNPQGQGDELTPICIIREINE